MINYRLNSYVSTARANGVSDEQIKTELLNAGWGEKKIENVLNKNRPTEVVLTTGEIVLVPQATKRSSIYLAFFVIVMLVVVAGIALLWGSQAQPVRGEGVIVKDNPVPPAIIEVDDILEEDKINPDTKDIYIRDKVDFVEADLAAKIVHLYQGGVEIKAYEILAFGRDGSWWETPTGDYSVLGKETRHFSSIGEVWMPWSMNFYGNFFIHGWPYYEGGEPVEPGHSGGCIRLSVEDAKDLYQYVSKGTPVLVREPVLLSKFGNLTLENKNAPTVSANSFLVSNIATGETLLKKNSEVIVSDAPIAKLMTAVIATELIYIERSLHVAEDMVVPAPTLFEPTSGEEYVTFDLFYPLLMQSSDTAANIIASSLGNRYFIDLMNKKAVSLRMNSTHFENTHNLEINNTSSLRDMFKLLQYTYFKRAFLYKVTKGEPYRIYSGEHSMSLENLNKLTGEELVGTQERMTADGDIAMSVWEMKTPSGPVPVSIIMVGSRNAAEDTKTLFDWLQGNAVMK